MSTPITDYVRALFSSSIEEENRELVTYFTSEPPITNVPVPGDIRPYPKKSDPARLSHAAIVEWITEINRGGKTLDGKFAADSFCITALGFLRGKQSLLPLLRDVDDIGVEQDMKAVGIIIEDDIYQKQKLPPDVDHLVKMLKSFEKGKSFLVRFHLCHEAEQRKSAVYVMMFDTLKVLQGNDSAKYTRIMNTLKKKIPIKTNNAGWIATCGMNKYLHQLLHFGAKPVYAKSGAAPVASSSVNVSTAAVSTRIPSLVATSVSSGSVHTSSTSSATTSSVGVSSGSVHTSSTSSASSSTTSSVGLLTMTGTSSATPSTASFSSGGTAQSVQAGSVLSGSAPCCATCLRPLVPTAGTGQSRVLTSYTPRYQGSLLHQLEFRRNGHAHLFKDYSEGQNSKLGVVPAAASTAPSPPAAPTTSSSAAPTAPPSAAAAVPSASAFAAPTTPSAAVAPNWVGILPLKPLKLYGVPDPQSLKGRYKLLQFCPIDIERMFAVSIPHQSHTLQEAMDDEDILQELGCHEPSRRICLFTT